jgi:4-hydroxy-tetrahydrodipicolinate synthase
VIAALLLPRDPAGRPSWQDFDRNAALVLSAGASGLCVNGATGEYAAATRQERQEAVVRARRIAGPSTLVVSGVGSTVWTRVLSLARDSEEAGADALLVPAPHFFEYAPDDLAEFYERVAEAARIPVLIYNLPAFTGGLPVELAVRLIGEQPGIAGIKDSSGRLDILERLAAQGGGATALVGNDTVLAEALRRGLCDGVISGVAGVAPELTIALWRSAQSGDWERFALVDARLRELIAHLESFPTPWGLKVMAEARGLGRATYALPLSKARQAQIAAFHEWFSHWWSETALVPGEALDATGEARPI